MRTLDLPASKRHVFLYDEDWEWLEARFGSHSINPIGVAKAIRTILHNRIKLLKAVEETKLNNLVTGENK